MKRFSMAKGGGGGGGGGCHPQRIFPVSLVNGESEVIFICNFILGVSFHEKISDWSYRLGPKIDKGRVLRGWQPPPPIEQKLAYFSSHEDGTQF